MWDRHEPQSIIVVHWREQLRMAPLGDSFSAGEGLAGDSDGNYLG